MYYDTIILRFFDDEFVKKENNYYFKEEGSYKKHYEKYINYYWRIRISTKNSHETRGTFIIFRELKNIFKMFPLAIPYLKFDNPEIDDDTNVFVKISGRGKNLIDNLTELKYFINSDKCTAFDVKYGIITNEIELYQRKIYKSSRKNDIVSHNETGYAMHGYIKNNEWVCYKNTTSVLKLREIITKNKNGENEVIKKIVTAFHFEYTNNLLSEEFIEPEYLPLIRKLKLAQIFSD